MSKQTALDWYRLESQKLMIKAIREEISNEEWRLLENKLGEEAKQIEREQIKLAFAEGQEYEYQYHINSTPKFDSKTYYIETYGVKGKENKTFMSEEEWVKEYTGEKGRDIG